jgi:hypothetical protein
MELKVVQSSVKGKAKACVARLSVSAATSHVANCDSVASVRLELAEGMA